MFNYLEIRYFFKDIKKVASSNVYLMTEHELKKNGEKEEKKNQNSKRLEEVFNINW